jgi:hypothetical protein
MNTARATLPSRDRASCSRFLVCDVDTDERGHRGRDGSFGIVNVVLTKLAALAGANAAFVDDKRELIWVTQADGTIASVPVAAGGATPAQLATSVPMHPVASSSANPDILRTGG